MGNENDMKNGKQDLITGQDNAFIDNELIKYEITGWKEINETLKWLDKRFTLIGEGPVLIKNASFIDEEHKIDRIIVGPVGVILLEVRAYSGKIIIDKYGNWRRKTAGLGWVGETNPLQDTRRHEKLIKSILPDDIPVKSILCLSDNSIIIKGIENTPLDIVKCDLLVEKIENMAMTMDENFRWLSDQKIADVASLIEKYIV